MKLDFFHQHAPYLCKRCNNKFKFDTIKYVDDGKTLVCTDCYSKIKAENQKKSIAASEANKVPEVIKIICVDCRYKFSLRRGSSVKPMCPYCGGIKLIKDEITATKLIEEVSKGEMY